MFGSQTRFFVGLAISLACAVTVLADSDFYIIKGDFIETNDNMVNATMSGTFFYMYNKTNSTFSRLTFQYNTPDGAVVSNLYKFEENAMYSMCTDTCKGIRIFEGADKWWYDSAMYNSTGETEDGLTWYVRNNVGTGQRPAQVMRILMSSATAPTDASYNVKKILFAGAEGRNITVRNLQVSPSGISPSSSIFETNSSLDCPRATCPMFVDMVFVMDYSGSVSSTEWMQAANFTVAVMESFTFGVDAVEAAIVQFNGPSVKKSYTRSISGCGSRYYADANFSETTNQMRKATVLAGQLLSDGNYTVSSDRSYLINTIQTPRTPSGNTCQAFGLELAMDVLKRSPRYPQRVQPIVIAVSDGADHCPNRTRAAANKLMSRREDGGYDAFVIEIGVGLACNYDKELLKNFSSRVTSETDAAYYDVTNYAAIKKVAEDLFQPLCDEFTSGCGTDCHGFCGCGTCFCPTCNNAENMCLNATCNPYNTWEGCKTVEDPCDEGDKCLGYSCNPNAPNKESRCVEVRADCSSLATQYPGTCRTPDCDPMNGCKLKLNHSVCRDDACEKWACADKNISSSLVDASSGCYLVLNQTAACESSLGAKLAADSCFKLKCLPNYEIDPINCDDWLEDTCVPSNKCYTSSCQLKDGKYQCVENPVPHDADTPCHKQKCFPEVGWGIDEDRERNKTTCKRFMIEAGLYTEEQLRCNDFDCDDNKTVGEPCFNTSRSSTTCNAQCDDNTETGCENEATQNSTLKKCFSAHCAVTETTPGSGNYQTYCDPTAEVDCTKEDVQEQLRVYNEATKYTACYNVECRGGSCAFVIQDSEKTVPASSRCQRAVCTKKGDVWGWGMEDTEEAAACGSNSTQCQEYTCDDKLGCVPHDICTKKASVCGKYVCVNNSICEYVSTLESNECMEEKCIYDADHPDVELERKWVVKENLDEACGNTAKCIVSKCDTSTGTCYFEESPQPVMDPCRIFTCDNATGWSDEPLCNDGLYCTKDTCKGGKCGYERISCTDILQITERCYVGECTEVPENQTYLCETKLVEGAVIDICGKCILEGDLTSDLEEVVGECVEAPEQEILKEGLAAATIAMIVLAAIIAGAAIAVSGIMGTKALIERARAANNQSAHSNPLFEGNNAEMTNPTYGEADGEEQ